MRTATIRKEFEAVLPRIHTHAVVMFHAVACPHTRDELIAETVALCWKWFLRLRKRGEKDPNGFVSALADFATRAARSGRRLCGHEKANDALSPFAQRHHGFRVNRFPAYSTQTATPLTEALHDNTRTPVAEQAAFRCDFPAWLSTYDERRRQIIAAMLEGEPTRAVAAKFHVTAGRISQMRREFLTDWRAFIGDA